MKQTIVLGLFIIFLCQAVAADFSVFPNDFAPENTFDGYIVVGTAGSSQDVIGQSKLGLALASYLNAPQPGINKLDSEVDLDNNLILIGNPCVNTLTSELLGDPEPCDKDFPAGIAFLISLEQDEYHYIIAAGHSPEGNRAAAEYLAAFKSKTLRSDRIEIEVEGEEKEKKEEKKKEIEEEVIELVDDTDSKPKTQVLEEEPSDEPVVVKEKRGFWRSIAFFFKNLFT